MSPARTSPAQPGRSADASARAAELPDAADESHGGASIVRGSVICPVSAEAATVAVEPM